MSNDKLLSNVSSDQEFHLANGRRLKNMHELVNALTSMDDTTFHHHVNYEKNDFANWIRGAFNDDSLAKKIERTKNRKLILKRVHKALHHEEHPEPTTPPKKKTSKPATRLKPRSGKPKGFGVSSISKEVTKIKEVMQAKVKEHEGLLEKDERKKQSMPPAIEQALKKKEAPSAPPAEKKQAEPPKEGLIKEKPVEKKRWGYWGDTVIDKINKGLEAKKKSKEVKENKPPEEPPQLPKESEASEVKKIPEKEKEEPIQELKLEKPRKKDPLLDPLPTEEPVLPSKEEPKDAAEAFLQREPTHHELNKSHQEIRAQLEEILSREKEIQLREQKILEIESRLEQKLAGEKEGVFFSKEFVQGIVTGLLVTIILALVYLKFGLGA